MFYECKNFNQALNKWNVSYVKDMSRIFCGCENFNQQIYNWNVINVERMSGMFEGCASLHHGYKPKFN